MVDSTLRPLYLRKRVSTHCIGGWVGRRAGLDRCGKSRPHGVRSTDRPVAIPTELSRHQPLMYRSIVNGNIIRMLFKRLIEKPEIDNNHMWVLKICMFINWRRRFGGNGSVLIQGLRNYVHANTEFVQLWVSLLKLPLKMEVESSYEMLVHTYQCKWHYILL